MKINSSGQYRRQGLQSVLCSGGVQKRHLVVRILRVTQPHQQFVTARREPSIHNSCHDSGLSSFKDRSYCLSVGLLRQATDRQTNEQTHKQKDRVIAQSPAFAYHSIIMIPRQCLWCCHHGRASARVHPVYLIKLM